MSQLHGSFLYHYNMAVMICTVPQDLLPSLNKTTYGADVKLNLCPLTLLPLVLDKWQTSMSALKQQLLHVLDNVDPQCHLASSSLTFSFCVYNLHPIISTALRIMWRKSLHPFNANKTYFHYGLTCYVTIKLE